MDLKEFVWRYASSVSPIATWAFLFNFPCPVRQCDQGSSRKMWVSLHALEIFLFTFLDWPNFHLAEYFFLLWMPFKNLWDTYSNYFFTLTTMQKESISRAAKREQNQHGHPAQHQDALLNSSMLRNLTFLYENGVIVFFATSSFRMCFISEPGGYYFTIIFLGCYYFYYF